MMLLYYFHDCSVGDVLIGLFSIPFQFRAALLQRWDMPHLLCPIAPFVKELTVNVSILTLAVISADRYRAVVYPLRPRCSCRLAVCVMTGVWVFSALTSLPTIIAFSVISVHDEGDNGEMKDFCFPQFPIWWGTDVGKLYRLLLAVIQYFLPLVVISYCYCRIICRIWLTKAPGTEVRARDISRNRNKRKVNNFIQCNKMFKFSFFFIFNINICFDAHTYARTLILT